MINFSRVRSVLSLLTLLFGIVTLIATSPPKEIPSKDTSLRFEMEEGRDRFDLAVVYRGGPVDFQDYPLLASFTITHRDPAEPFAFDDQSWTVISQSPTGDQRRQLVVLKQGVEEVFEIDPQQITLSGIVSLNACDESDLPLSAKLCIPCDLESDRCEFTLALSRQGQPYPAEEVLVELSQWTTEGADFKIEVSAR